MKVEISKLRAIAQALLAHLEDTCGGAVDVDVDFYWEVDASVRYDSYAESPGLNLGQLSDDWNELNRLLAGQIEPINHDLVCLAAILRRCGEQCLG